MDLPLVVLRMQYVLRLLQSLAVGRIRPIGKKLIFTIAKDAILLCNIIANLI
jgi:hypothetical protein